MGGAQGCGCRDSKDVRDAKDFDRAAYLTLGIAERMRASDIHVHGSAENLAVIRIRVDGVLHTVARFDLRLTGPLTGGLLAEVKVRALQGGVDFEALPKQFRVAQGCKRCGKTGYCGRLAVGEALTVTPEILHALRNGAGAHEVEKIAIEQGMVTLPAQGIRAAASGATTLDEVFRIFR